MTWRLLLLCILISGAAAQGAESLKSAAKEQFERDVDEVALASQEKAISRVNGLLKKYMGTHQESILLSKLAELEQQTGAILFRIAHGVAHTRQKPIDLAKYHRAMKQSVKTLTTLISKYPNFEEIPQAYYMRGKALEEVGSKLHAAEDYSHLVGHFPDSESVPAAYMSLAEFAIEANEHAKAIGYLKHVEERPEDPHYPFALYKLAWSHYNLKQIDKALSFAERQVAFYDARKKEGEAPEAENVVTSDNALRENTLMDITTFHLDGYETGAERFKLDDTLAYFRKLEKGPLLGRMLFRYAKLLRSHGHEADLVRWKDLTLKAEGERSEMLDVVLTVYENQLNKRRYSQLVETAQDFVKLYPNLKKLPDFQKAQKIILETAEGLQLLIVKNKGAKEVGDLSKTLAQIYDSFTHVVEESDPRIPRVHYNLAETLFTIKDYDTATKHYRWVVEHGSWSSGRDAPKRKASMNSLDPDAPFATVPDASLKAIASRYEVLRARKQIPIELIAKGEKESTDKELEPVVAEWVQWIDTHVDHTYEDMDNFYFEGNRVLYVQGHVAKATERLKKFAFKHSKSTYAIPSASLVIDTYMAGKEWKRTHELANDLMDVKEWKGSEFGKRLFSVSADSFYKQIETLYNAKEYKSVIGECEDFLKKYSASTRLADTLSLAGNSAMNVGEREKALTFFSRLITETPKSGNISNALLARAQLEEERYDFHAASADYRSYLSLPPAQQKADAKQLDNLRRKALVLSWISGNAEELRLALESKVVCGEGSNVAAECARYKLLGRVLDVNRKQPGSLDEKQTAEAFAAARGATGDMRTLYAALALEGLPHLAFRDRNHVVRWVSGGWADLEPIVKFSLLPALTLSLPKSFAMNRASMKEVAPLRADEKYITRRVEVIREMENAATEVMKLPWARIRAEVLSELASLYLDLSHGLATLPPPKGLSTEDLAQYDAVIHKLILPFEEKGQEMRGKAFEIASRAAIEEDAFHKIADPFFQENPSQAKALKPVSDAGVPAAVDLALLSKLDPSGGWKLSAKVAPSKIEEPVARFKAAWMFAVQSRAWPQVAFFMNEAKEKALIPASMMGVVRAVSLAAAGARGEALAELEDSKRDLNPIAKNIVVTTLLQYSLRACSREHTLALLKDVQPDSLSRDQAALVTHATSYAAEQSKKR